MCVRIHVCVGGVLYNSLLQVNERVRKALDLCLRKYLWDATGGQQWLLVQQDHALLVVLAAKKKKRSNRLKTIWTHLHFRCGNENFIMKEKKKF